MWEKSISSLCRTLIMSTMRQNIEQSGVSAMPLSYRASYLQESFPGVLPCTFWVRVCLDHSMRVLFCLLTPNFMLTLGMGSLILQPFWKFNDAIRSFLHTTKTDLMTCGSYKWMKNLSPPSYISRKATIVFRLMPYKIWKRNHWTDMKEDAGLRRTYNMASWVNPSLKM